VGVATIYRHFPERSDLIAAVFRKEVDACAEVARRMSARYSPGEALDRWLKRFIHFVATKRGLSGSPAFGGPGLRAIAPLSVGSPGAGFKRFAERCGLRGRYQVRRRADRLDAGDRPVVFTGRKGRCDEAVATHGSSSDRRFSTAVRRWLKTICSP
jgi:AcrR family transcriptional regulator